MKDLSFVKDLVWITELGLSVAGPLVIFVVGSVWLMGALETGPWIVVLGAILGVIGAVGGLLRSLKTMNARKNKQDDKTQFNEHI